MNRSSIRSMGAAATMALLAACGAAGSQPLASGAAGDARATNNTLSEDLLYVSDQPTGDVYVFSYRTGRLVQTLTDFAFPWGLCTDAAGDVYVADQGSEQVDEYAHGGSQPVQAFKDVLYPVACAVDPATGDLAVANENGTVIVYPPGDSPTTYVASLIPWFVTFDDAGNLYADSSGAPGVRIAELPKGAGSFEMLEGPNHNNGMPAGMQWAGKRLDVGSESPYPRGCCGRIFQDEVGNGEAKRAGFTHVASALHNFY